MGTLNRRDLLRVAGASVLGWSASGWLPVLADEVAQNPQRKRHCILLWMSGGPSQTDTFDMKPNHVNGGEFKEIETNVPGLRISEHLPKLATQADKLAIVRSLSTKEGDHGRGTFLMRTGRQPRGPVRYPTIGAALSKELGDQSDLALNFVSVAPYRAFNQAAYGPGFLGPKYAPLTVGATDNLPLTPGDANQYAELRVDDLSRPSHVTEQQFNSRLKLWRLLQDGFLANHHGPSPVAHDTVYRRALSLMNSNIAEAFDLGHEPEGVRAAYGRGRVGQGCLMARRLIERGVAFVEVSLGSFDGSVGWDTHQANFATVRQLSNELDAGWGTLMQELSDRGLLESTTILWMGEFGRTPAINDNAGRDHFPAAWTCVFGGGGIKGGQAYGRTSDDGTEVADGKVNEADVLTTLCSALGVSPSKENISEQGRPIKIAEGTPISGILAASS